MRCVGPTDRRLMPDLVERIDGFQAQSLAFDVDVVNHDSLGSDEARIIAQRLEAWPYIRNISSFCLIFDGRNRGRE